MTPEPAQSPVTDEQLADHLRGLVTWIGLHERPENWPLTDEQRIRFLRGCVYRAGLIANSEPFLRANVMTAIKACADVFLCDEADFAGTVQKPRAELIALGREHPDHLRTDREIAQERA